MLKDRKNLLVVFLFLALCYLGYDLYKQNQVINLLNSEILRQSTKRRALILNNQRLMKQVEELKVNSGDSIVVKHSPVNLEDSRLISLE